MSLEKRMHWTWKQAYKIWLNGRSFEEKLKTLERGKTEVCIKCDEVFYDKEDDRQRTRHECIPPESSHECVAHENYIILWRGFAGIIIPVFYPDSITPEDAMINYFKEHYKERRNQNT